jgi:hypothetical protein
VAARVVALGGAGWKGGADLDVVAVLSLHAFELRVPALVVRENSLRSLGRFEAYLKVPWAIASEHHVAAILGFDFPANGPPLNDAGFSAVLAYAYAADAWSGQLRIGLGHGRFPGAPEDAARTIVWIDGSASLRLGPHFSAVVDAEYKHNLGAPGHALRFWPGARFYPFEDASLSLGAAALIWIEGTPPGPEELRRLGAVIEIVQRWP